MPFGESSASSEELEELGYRGGEVGQVGGCQEGPLLQESLVSDSWLQDTLLVVKAWW